MGFFLLLVNCFLCVSLLSCLAQQGGLATKRLLIVVLGGGGSRDPLLRSCFRIFWVAQTIFVGWQRIFVGRRVKMCFSSVSGFAGAEG